VKTRLLVVALVLLAACGTPSDSDSIPPRSTAAEPVSTTTVPARTTAPEVPTAGSTAPLEPQICGPDEEALLCEVFELLTSRYVDTLDEEALATAAAAAVDALDESTSNDPECHIPSLAFIVVCAAMEDEGVSTHIAEVAAVEGLMTELDPNSVYLSAEALRLLEEDQSGSVEGIGALVSSEDLTAADPSATPCGVLSETCRLVVVSTFADGPADRAGLEVGDVLVAVDGESILDWTVDDVTAAVRGEAGTTVVLQIERAGDLVNLSIVREALIIPVVEIDQIGDVGYLRLNLFTDTSDEQVHDAIEDLLAGGAERMILDLRDNPGGALRATIEIASEFISDGVVVRTEGPEESIDYDAEGGGLLSDGTPLVILVNQGSASASEVLAAALQEQDRALVIGTATFGKNTVQQRYPLSDGGALKLTVARWVTGQGSDFGETGVLPDIEADFGPELSVGELVAEVGRLSGW
jgi:carboxyl-terminal processing protease